MIVDFDGWTLKWGDDSKNEMSVGKRDEAIGKLFIDVNYNNNRLLYRLKQD